jgi:hypothetical protein
MNTNLTSVWIAYSLEGEEKTVIGVFVDYDKALAYAKSKEYISKFGFESRHTYVESHTVEY